MNKLAKIAATCLLSLFLLTGAFAAAFQALTAAAPQPAYYAEEQKKPDPPKPAEPGKAPSDEDEGGCKC